MPDHTRQEYGMKRKLPSDLISASRVRLRRRASYNKDNAIAMMESDTSRNTPVTALVGMDPAIIDGTDTEQPEGTSPSLAAPEPHLKQKEHTVGVDVSSLPQTDSLDPTIESSHTKTQGPNEKGIPLNTQNAFATTESEKYDRDNDRPPGLILHEAGSPQLAAMMSACQSPIAPTEPQPRSNEVETGDLPEHSSTTQQDVTSHLQDHVLATAQTAPIIVADTDFDEAYAESTCTSYATSISSSISNGVLENERLYPNYGQHSYGMPIDEDEMDRMDLQHRKYELVLGGKHFLAPISPNPQRILDLGTGTGIWALDIADLYPSAAVVGVDIAPIQPKWVAPNCQFEIDDVEATWTYRRDSFDFIHFRDPLYCIRDWPRLVSQCYEHLKPGGWCELACIYPEALCDDRSMPPDSAFKLICDKFMEASVIMGAPTSAPLRFATYLRDAGFVDVAEYVYKVPSSPWPKDRRLKQIGALEMTNVVEGSTAFGLRAFSQAFGWTREQTELAMVNFRKDVKNRNYHQYVKYFVVYGRRPGERPDPAYH